MEIPPLVVLYGVLLAVGVAAVLYTFQIYDITVERINSASCDEVAALAAAAAASAYYHPGNYAAVIKLGYPVVIKDGHLVVGKDTARPARCQIAVPKYVDAPVTVVDGVGREIVVKKKSNLVAECSQQQVFPGLRYVKSSDVVFIAKRCQPGQITEGNVEIEIFVR